MYMLQRQVGALSRAGKIEAAANCLMKCPRRRCYMDAIVMGTGKMGFGESKTVRLMPARNVVSWNSMIAGLVKYDRLEEASRLFEEMPRRNVISYTAMIDGYAKKGDLERQEHF
ncbi:pentatricopeptide repeat-containing protein [Prunus yedoensis var. nudiflora]|uniref:Pentatricopeptide repeat-containing protein n=1 Tax=Prunus yedoensis var. nudiflora TaxID=2094558 RepID=A0A314XFI7_PRUYE|nr:pentatricopeptide repeat-containing protein [Prunus yedoensis var. nudiflora]